MELLVREGTLDGSKDEIQLDETIVNLGIIDGVGRMDRGGG